MRLDRLLFCFSFSILATAPLTAGEIHDATQESNLEKVRALLAEDPDLRTATDDSQRMPLHWAAIDGSPELLAAVFDPSALEAKDFLGLTPLHLAATWNPEATRWLLGKGAPIDAPSRLERATPLHWAAEQQNLETLKLLLDAGANPDVENAAGSTPLLSAVKLETEKTVPAARLLIEAGATVDAANRGGITPLVKASAGGRADVVALLLEHGANPRQKTMMGETGLQAAAQLGHIEVVRLLLEAGADPQATNRRGQSARDAAEAAGHAEIVELLDRADG